MEGNEIIPYVFYLEDYINKPSYITTMNMIVALRPIVGNEVRFRESNKQYRVVRVDPESNPDNQSNAYYVVDMESPAAQLRLTGMDSKGL